MSRTAAVGGLAGAGLVLLVVLLAVLSATTGLGPAGWAVGLVSGISVTAAVVLGMRRAGLDRPGPADVVTYGRAVLTCAVAGLATEAVLGLDVSIAVVALAVPALLLDAVDGQVARRTRTTAFGARFDGEADAFLILVLSVVVGSMLGWWVLAAGLVRYVFAVAGWVLPWLRRPLEPRYWRKVVTATVGIVLVIAVADVLPRWLTGIGVVIALGLLAESFGRDVWWLWRHRREGVGRGGAPGSPLWSRLPRRVRVGGSVLATVAAMTLLWIPLVAPTDPDRLTPASFVRLPLEVLVLGALALVASTGTARWGRTVSLLGGGLVAIIAVAKLLDLATFAVLGRSFNLAADRTHLGHGVEWARLAMGPWATRGIMAGAIVLLALLALGLPWAVARLTSSLGRRPRTGRRLLALGGLTWMLCALLGVQLVSGVPFAAADTSRYVVHKVDEGVSAHRDLELFERALSSDPLGDAASVDLSALAGKDVAIVFVESYGRVALEGTGSEQVRETLRDSEARLGDVGYQAASAYLTSPTFGGSSWLAHSTLQAGVTVSGDARYDLLLKSSRATLASTFRREGWRTVAVLPGSRGDWPEGRAFFRFEQVYDRSGLGYAGPRFGFSTPDQFTLTAFGELELDESDRPPVLAQVELTSSHAPWAPLPTMVAPDQLGDGSVYHRMHAAAASPTDLWRDRSQVRAAYRQAISYSLSSVVAFLEQRHGDDLVLILLGDHQPSTIVSGFGGDHDVPVSIISRDPMVLERIGDWGWQSGLAPDVAAPVWPMADFRDRFLTAFSSAGSR